MSDEAKDLIKKLLVIDPEQHFSAEKALEHPWFQGKSTAEHALEQPWLQVRLSAEQTLERTIAE